MPAPPTPPTGPAPTAERLDRARARFAADAFARRLGVAIADLAPDRATLVLPYRDEHMNAAGVLNGGCSASLLLMAATVAAWSGMDLDAPRELGCVDLALQYLAAGAEDDVTATARVLRRGRDLAFVDVAVDAAAGTPICHGLVTYRSADHGGHAPRRVTQHVPLPAPSPIATPPPSRLFRGYVAARGMAPVHESPGRVRLSMPCTPDHVDEQGRMHAGALASIVDIAAVAASWSLVSRRPGARGSTIAMQVSFPGVAADAVVADAHVQQRAEELMFNTVHVTSAASGQLLALGQVSYRLIEPWPDASRAR